MYRRSPVGIRGNRQEGALSQQPAAHVKFRRQRDPAEVAPVDTRDSVLLGQPLIQEGIIRVQKIRHRTVFLNHARHEHFNFRPHGLAQNIVEIRIDGGHRSLGLQGAQAEPLAGEVAHQLLRPRILEHAPDLLFQNGVLVQFILAGKGRVVVTGMGKSGHVGRKIAASLASTGTPAFFMHPAEAFHGDLGMVTENDIVLAISNSGESTEIVNILALIKRIGATIIAMSGRRDSTLGKNAEFFIDIGVEREACPLGLAPTASTTATLAMGDAITIALLSARNFTAQDFALFHPGGALGRKLLLTVENIMHSGEDNPVISVQQTAKEALFMMTDKGLGATSVVDGQGFFIGLVTDGDIRRGLAKGSQFLDEPIENLMTRTPKTISKEKLAAAALSVMEKNKPRPITVLPVVDNENKPIGIVHLTDLLRQGVV